MRPVITRILVPIDFSEHSGRALRYAETLAERLGATLHLVHAIEMPAMWGSETYTVDLGTLLDEMTADATRRMAECRAGVPAALSATSGVELGRPAEVIAQAALDSRADLVVMGTHGRSGLSHLMMGSVAERIIRTAPCPVLTVRDKVSASMTDASA
jgi:universal stress protein A